MTPLELPDFAGRSLAMGNLSLLLLCLVAIAALVFVTSLFVDVRRVRRRLRRLQGAGVNHTFSLSGTPADASRHRHRKLKYSFASTARR
jgi:hypothetical protein